MNYLFCNKKCLGEINQLLITLRSNRYNLTNTIDMLNRTLEQEGEQLFTKYMFIETGCAIIAFIFSILAGIGAASLLHAFITSICIFAAFLFAIPRLFRDVIKKEFDARTGYIYSALATLENYANQYDKIAKKINLYENMSVAELSNHIHNLQSAHKKFCMKVDEYNDEQIRITVLEKGEKCASDDGTAIFASKDKSKSILISKSTSARIFPNQNTCDFSWLNGTAEEYKSVSVEIERQVDQIRRTPDFLALTGESFLGRLQIEEKQ